MRSVAHFLQTAHPLYTHVDSHGQATHEILPRWKPDEHLLQTGQPLESVPTYDPQLHAIHTCGCPKAQSADAVGVVMFGLVLTGADVVLLSEQVRQMGHPPTSNAVEAPHGHAEQPYTTGCDIVVG